MKYRQFIIFDTLALKKWLFRCQVFGILSKRDAHNGLWGVGILA